MIAMRHLTSWYERARRDQLPVSVVGGTSRTFKCPRCGFESPDVETVWAEMWGHEGMNRRRRDRRAA